MDIHVCGKQQRLGEHTDYVLSFNSSVGVLMRSLFGRSWLWFAVEGANM